MTKIEELLNILKGKVLLSLFAGIVLIIIGIIINHIFLIFFYIIIFNVFDFLGYSKLVNSDNNNPNIEVYRILQTMFQIIILLLIYFIAGFWIVLSGELIHLTGGQDLLYYWIGNYTLDKEWTWLSWTPVGWFWNNKKPIPLIVVEIQAIVGLIISIVICILIR
jgi:hypothetical protein